MTKPIKQTNCPNYDRYTKAQWKSIENAVSLLPSDSPLIPFIQDYLDLVDKVKICRGQNK